MFTMALEYVPGTGDSLMLLYDFNLYYRVKNLLNGFAADQNVMFVV